MADFRAQLAHEPCWDVDRRFVETADSSVPGDHILQDREELIQFCEWIERHDIRSYLEIGIWTGRLLSTLHRLFRFDRVAACDLGIAIGWGLPLHLPPEANTLWNRSDSPEYTAWRRALGSIDLVFIDGDHSAEGIQRDFDINRECPHRFLAFHDIAGTNPATAPVRHFWQRLEGFKREIVRPCAEWEFGTDAMMGIGIWSSTERP